MEQTTLTVDVWIKTITTVFAISAAIGGYFLARTKRQHDIDAAWQTLNIELLKNSAARSLMHSPSSDYNFPEVRCSRDLRITMLYYQLNILHNIWLSRPYIRRAYYEPICSVHLKSIAAKNEDILLTISLEKEGYERDFISFFEYCKKNGEVPRWPLNTLEHEFNMLIHQWIKNFYGIAERFRANVVSALGKIAAWKVNRSRH